MKLFLSPHNDDLALFGSFTLLREKPLVLTILDSYIQVARGNRACTAAVRRSEDAAACKILGVDIEFLGFRDDAPDWELIGNRLAQYGQPEMVWAPCPEPGGHFHHNVIGDMARRIFPNVRHYMTYTREGKSRGRLVPFEPDWPLKKLRALACYETQIMERSTVDHFLRDQYEYMSDVE